MIYLLTEKDNTKEDVIASLSGMFLTDVAFKSGFPQFGTVNVRGIHPFAIFNQAAISGGDMPNLWPSISVSIVSESSGDRNLMGTVTAEGNLTQALLNYYKALNPKKLWTAQTILTDLQARLTAGDKMPYRHYERFYSGSIVLSIWSDNDEIRACLYDLCRSWVEAYQETVLHPNGWGELKWNSDRDGLYNFDTGRLLYGSSITISGVRTHESVRVSTVPGYTFNGVITAFGDAENEIHYHTLGEQ